MSAVAIPDLDERYLRLLRAWLDTPGEDELMAAYELGRAAIAEGLGLLEVAAAHDRALRKLVAEGLRPATLERSTSFVAECLSPFEMAIRGYREANEELRRLNEQLRHRNAELERAKAAVEAAVTELEAFGYSVSHDLRAPLRTILGFAKALEEDLDDALNDQTRDHLRRIRSGAERMQRLIDDLLTLSRLSRAELRYARVDLSALARETAERLRTAEPHRQVELTIEEGLVDEGDPGLLAVVIENLLSNAWKFTSRRERAHIRFGASSDGERVYYVQDDGAGFDMARAQLLFAPFQRLHSERDYPGTGIGLATVQRIIRRHGGRVWAEAEVDRGATFRFTLHPDAL